VRFLLKRAGVILLGAALSCWSAAAWGAGAPPGGRSGVPPGQKPGVQEKEIPLHITAAKLEADQEKHLITFSGQVKAVYGDSTLYCDHLLVYYKPTPAPAKGPPGAKPGATPEPSPLSDLGGEKIDRIVARGKVRYVQEDKVATGEEAVYYKDRELIELRGNPRVWQGENNLKGDKITLFLKTRRVLVESGARQRVEAHLYQPEGKGPGMKDLLPGAGPKPPRKPAR